MLEKKNMKRGRKSKPTAQKQAAGNPGKRKLNRGEPKAPIGLMLPAYKLGTCGAEAWAERVGQGETWLTPADARGLTDLCNWEGWLARWGPQLESLSPVLRTPDGVKSNPAQVRYMQMGN